MTDFLDINADMLVMKSNTNQLMKPNSNLRTGNKRTTTSGHDDECGNALQEEYDITGARYDNPYPWQREVAVQCCWTAPQVTTTDQDSALVVRQPKFRSHSVQTEIYASKRHLTRSVDELQRHPSDSHIIQGLSHNRRHLFRQSRTSGSEDGPYDGSAYQQVEFLRFLSQTRGIVGEFGTQFETLPIPEFADRAPSPLSIEGSTQINHLLGLEDSEDSDDPDKDFRRDQRDDPFDEDNNQERVSDDKAAETEGPPAAYVATRRTAIVPKFMEETNEDAELTEKLESGTSKLEEEKGKDSMVIIPPMNVCPGDLLVPACGRTVTKGVLSGLPMYQMNSCTLDSKPGTPKSKSGSWSFRKLFEKSGSRKEELLLEDFLASLKDTEFMDAHFAKYKNFKYSDFLAEFPQSDAKNLLKGDPKRHQAVWDLFKTECVFLYDHLLVLKQVFMEPLKKCQVEGFLMFAEPECLFGNLDMLCCVSYAFCREYFTLLHADILTHKDSFGSTEFLTQLFNKVSGANCDMFGAYHSYCLNYINALNYLEALRRHDDFCEFEKWCSQDKRCHRLQLQDLLIAPMQRCMKFPLLLKDIEKYTNDITQKQKIAELVQNVEHSLRDLDDKMKWLKDYETLRDLQKRIIWPSVTDIEPKTFIPEFLKSNLNKQPCEKLLASPKRHLLHDGTLLLMESNTKGTEVHVFLFDDMIIITRVKKGLSKKKQSTDGQINMSRNTENAIYYVQKQPLPLDRLMVRDLTAAESTASGLKHTFVIVGTTRFGQITGVYTLQALTEASKETWIHNMKAAIDKWKVDLSSRFFDSPDRKHLYLRRLRSEPNTEYYRKHSILSNVSHSSHVISDADSDSHVSDVTDDAVSPLPSETSRESDQFVSSTNGNVFV